jgi:hypothetical protein
MLVPATDPSFPGRCFNFKLGKLGKLGKASPDSHASLRAVHHAAKKCSVHYNPDDRDNDLRLLAASLAGTPPH